MNILTNKFNYKAATYEEVSCNLCGGQEQDVLSRKDRYGLPVRTLLCRRCGLVFISPRMTAADYDHFYNTAYRKQLERYKGHPILLDDIFVSAKRWGRDIAMMIRPHINNGMTIEVGSSCGGILAGFQEIVPTIQPIGIEPSAEEAAYAEQKGIRSYVALFERFNETLPPAQNFIIVRSLNHLLDPKQFIIRSHKQLAIGGKLIMAVLNFQSFCRQRGVIRTQIDHPYMFTERTIRAMAESGGFKTSYLVTKGDYVYYVGVKEAREPFAQLSLDPRAYSETKKTLRFWRLFPRLLAVKAKNLLAQARKH